MSFDPLGGSDAGDYLTGVLPQMVLGNPLDDGFLFSLNTAAYQTVDRKTSYRWGSQALFGRHEAIQFLGPGPDTISLQGVVYPAYRGGTGQMQRLRALASKGGPQQLLDGHGNVYGRWVIESVDERQSSFAGLGVPRKQEFTLQLRHFDGGDFSVILTLLSSLVSSWQS